MVFFKGIDENIKYKIKNKTGYIAICFITKRKVP